LGTLTDEGRKPAFETHPTSREEKPVETTGKTKENPRLEGARTCSEKPDVQLLFENQNRHLAVNPPMNKIFGHLAVLAVKPSQ
jgi:hypothetical protein